jgi:hypothetical protein
MLLCVWAGGRTFDGQGLLLQLEVLGLRGYQLCFQLVELSDQLVFHFFEFLFDVPHPRVCWRCFNCKGL